MLGVSVHYNETATSTNKHLPISFQPMMSRLLQDVLLYVAICSAEL